jgi:hypothetical protein
VKLPSLLTQFLYKHKKLSLPGIGVFLLDPAAVIPDEPGKDVHIPAHGIEFKRSSAHVVDDELIEYIKAHTGKMKSLALADLESYLTLGTELLNIGKPFYLEGIGTLTKDKDGNFEFSPGEFSLVRPDEGTGEKAERSGRKKQVMEEAHPDEGGYSISGRKILLTIAIVAGISVIAWGGYLMYRKSAATANEPVSSQVQHNAEPAKPDSTSANKPAADSSVKRPSAGTSLSRASDSIMYKYIILRTHDKPRALRRYNQLLSYDLQVRMEAIDSSYFKVYFSFPSVSRDTIHIKDSLYRVYAHPVTIER